MKKFAVMIFSVSMFFFVLGGVARPFLDKFKSEKHTVSFTHETSEEGKTDSEVREVKTLNFVNNNGQNILIKIPERNVIIEQKVRTINKGALEFERQPNPEEIPRIEGLPRIPGKSVMIIKRLN